MDQVRQTTVKNNVWRRMSKNLNKEGISRLASTFRQACSRLFVCGQTKADGKVTRSYNGDISASFNIPDIDTDKENGEDTHHPSNAEILAQIDRLEKRFKQQSIILEKHGRKRPKINIDTELPTKRASRYYGDIEPTLKPDPLSVLQAKLRPARLDDAKFAVLQELVIQMIEKMGRSS